MWSTLGQDHAGTLAGNGSRTARRALWWVAPTYGLAFEPWRTLKEASREIREAGLKSARHIDFPAAGRSPSNRQTIPIRCAAWGWTSW